MSVLSVFILSATSVFLVTLTLQNLVRIKFCAVCVTISLSWLSLLVLRLIGYSVDPVLVGILMGESVVGLYYLFEKRVVADLQIFRWPFIITASTVVYFIVSMRGVVWSALVLLVLIWIVWGVIFVLRKYPSVNKIAQRLIACCRDW